MFPSIYFIDLQKKQTKYVDTRTTNKRNGFNKKKNP